MRLPFFIKFVQDRKEYKNYGKYNFTAYQLQQNPYQQTFKPPHHWQESLYRSYTPLLEVITF